MAPLQAWTKKGRVKASKKMTMEQMKATLKATKEFLKSPISTKRGIKKAKQSAIETLQQQYGSDIKDLTTDEAESLYSFFEDDEVNDVTNYIPRVTSNWNYRRL